MDVSAIAFLVLLAAVGVLRAVELIISRQHQRGLMERGAQKVAEPCFPWMALVHGGVLGGAALEVVLLKRPFYPVLGGVMALVFVCANGLRWWVIRTLGTHWNVQVMDSTGLGVVTAGPYRWIRHPNYVAVFAEMLALPLIHTAWLTALWGSASNLLVLRKRLEVEERVLLADPVYRATVGTKPRFLPRLSGKAAGSANRAADSGHQS